MRSHCGQQFHVTVEFGWSGVAQCSAHQRASILGKLGGHVAHDPPATSGCGGGDVPCLRAGAVAADQLTGVDGFSPPSWEALAAGTRPPPHEPDDNEPGCSRFGWQHEASSRVERQFRELLLSVMSDSEKAMLRSQGGCGAGAAFSTSPNCALTRIEPPFFRTLLLRRLHPARLPVWPTTRLLWPPPCSLRQVWSSGNAWVCRGECCCPRVSRGRSARHHKHPRSRHGCCPPESSRHETSGGGRGRAPLVRGAAVGLGHHTRVEFALRRVASAWSSKQRWCSVGHCAPTEEPNVSRAHRTSRPPVWLCWLVMLVERWCEGQIAAGTSHPAQKG